jgi:predicted GNAT family N-acyltransferase
MKITLTALSVKHLFGRNLVTCVPRNQEGQQLLAELPLSTVLNDVKKSGHEITNAQEVLECIVSQYGFAA